MECSPADFDSLETVDIPICKQVFLISWLGNLKTYFFLKYLREDGTSTEIEEFHEHF